MSRMLKALEQIERRRAGTPIDEAIESLEARCAEAACEFSAAPPSMDIASGTAEAFADSAIEPDQMLSSDCFIELAADVAWGPELESQPTAVEAEDEFVEAELAELAELESELASAAAEIEPEAELAELESEHASAGAEFEPEVEPTIECQDESTCEEVEPEGSPTIRIGRFDLEAESIPLAEIESLPWHRSALIEEEEEEEEAAQQHEAQDQQQSDPLFDEVPAEPMRTVYELPTDPERTDACRALAQQIVQRARSHGPHVVLFATVVQTPRSEFSIVDLAAAISREQRGATIVIDARPDRPWLSRLASAQGQPGLTDLLHGADWNDVPRETTTDRVDFLPVGRRLWAEPGAGTSDADFGGTLALQYRFVLIDAGPADSDACQYLARACDDVYLVLGLKDTWRAAAQQAIAALNAAGAPLAGCIAVEPA